MDELNMADPRLTNHQNFDLIRCRLCNRVHQEPKLLPCLHSFCLSCLQDFVHDNMSPSESEFPCPTCQETVDLPPGGGVNHLTTNRILERYIGQTHRDQTMRVAGREVLEMQRQALTEAELQSPVVMTTIQQIATTASHVIANGMAEQDQVHSFDTVKDRVDLQTRAKRLQDQSIGIIHCIDHVNQDLKDWMDNKFKIRDAIKHRSQEIQETIRGIEKDLLLRLDDRDHDNNVRDEVHTVKGELHRSLKANITAADFIKLLNDHGTQSDIASYKEFLTKQEDKLLNNRIYINNSCFAFDFPKVDLQSSIELMFGTLSEMSEENVVWDPTDFELNVPSSSLEPPVAPSVGINVESSFSPLETRIRHEPVLYEGDEKDNQPGSQSPILQNSRNTSQVHQRRRPLKSMSFDATITTSWEPTTRDHMTISKSGYQLVNDDMNNNLNESNTEENAILNRKEPVAHGINLLIGQRSPIRRGSAPPSMIIDSLTRRRLSALSILERANINTDGLLSKSDIESGLSQARLEWLRENVKQKLDRRPSADSNS